MSLENCVDYEIIKEHMSEKQLEELSNIIEHLKVLKKKYKKYLKISKLIDKLYLFWHLFYFDFKKLKTSL